MTVTLTRARVPAFLRSSDFFLSIEDDLEEFEVPTQCYKDDTTVSGISSLTLLLSTLRFWGSSHIPPSLIDLSLVTRTNIFCRPWSHFVEACCMQTFSLLFR
jgi:hypothetical protein